MSMTRWQVGQRVQSTVNAQGLTKGQEYIIVGVSSNETFFGNFVTYEVEDIAGWDRYFVGNGHLVLKECV